MLSRPKMVMNHGRPAAGSERWASLGRETQGRQVDQAPVVGGTQAVVVAFEPGRFGQPLVQPRAMSFVAWSSSRLTGLTARSNPGAVAFTDSSVSQLPCGPTVRVEGEAVIIQAAGTDEEIRVSRTYDSRR